MQGSGTSLSYGILGGSPDNTLSGYDTSLTGTFGKLYVSSTSGAYTFVPNDTTINALTSTTTENFTFTVVDGAQNAQQIFTVTLNGVNDTAIITATTLGSDAGGVTEDDLLHHVVNGQLSVTDVDTGQNHFQTPISLAGVYGTFTFDATTGQWSYTLDNSKVQFLGKGVTTTDPLTVTSFDGTDSHTITVTINGTNDAPTISAHTDGAVTEDGGVQGSGHEAGTESTNGTITFADVDLSDSHTVSATPQAVGYVGTFTPSIASGSDLTGGVNGTVSWTFSVDDSAIDYLAVGESLVQKYDVKVDDGNGGSIIQTITVTINGTNDAPTISAHTDGAVTEDGGVQGSGHEAGTESTNGTITFADVDLSDSHTVSATPQAVGYVGTFTPSIASGNDSTGGVNGTVSWTFSVDDSAIDYLAVGESLVQKYDVKVDDGNGGSIIQTITVTINGTNDAPTISAHTDGAVTEDGGVQGSGHEAGTESTNGTITFADVDLSDSHTVSATPQAVGYVGTFTPSIASGSDSTGGVNGTVSWTFSVDDSAIDYLAVGESLVQKYDVKVDDGNGGSIIQTITVTINGTNDAPTISAHTDGAVTEDGGVQGSGHEAGTESTNGTITFADVDLSDSHTVSATPQAVGYVGTFTPSIASGSDSTGGVNGTVSWTFSVDDSAIDYLAVGESLVQKYDVKVDDGNGGSIIQTITVTINGTNDAPTISAHTDGAVTEDGGVQGSGHEAGTESTNGTITFADVDLSDSHTVSATPQAVGYVGTFTPSIASGSDSTGGVNGTVSWTFSVDDSAIDYLAVGESLVQKYDVKVDDGNGGSIIQTITVTINGTNDAPTISAHTDGAVTEDGGVQGSGHEAGTESTNGTITFADVDLSDSHTVSATPQAVGYVGTFTPSIASGSDSTGGVNGTVSWTFSVDDSAIDYLAVGESLVQKYDVKVDDGNGGSIIQTITVTINGTNDAPTISAHTDGAVTEDGGVQGSGHEAGTESTNGTITFADVDLSDSHTVSATPQAVGYVGTFTPSIASGSDSTGGVNGTVSWTFSVDDSAIDYLAVGESLVQKYDVKVDDGNGGSIIQTITVTINGTNDAPTISAHTDGAVTEDGGVQGSGHEAGTESTNGTITFADVDLSDSHTVSATPQAVGYVGTFTPSIASGSDLTGGVNGTVSWTFSVDDSAIDYLAVGESLVQKYDVKVDDGNGGSIIQTITVTINGTNDAPTISAHTDGAVTEDGGVQGSGHEAGTESTNGTITFADVDLSDSHTVSATPQAVGYVGTFTPSIASGSDSTGGVNGTVSWTFSVDDSAIDYLAVGESLVQKYDVKVDDGNGGSIIQTITVTINGTNDAPTISAHTDGAVTEDGGVQGSGHEAGTESTNGTITFADVDLSDSHTVSATPQAVGYVGTFTPSIASGSDSTGGVNGTVSWTFSVDDSAIDYLAVGESLVQKYDVKVDDGNGGSIIQTITVTINGTNDAPTISAHTDGAVTEDGGVQGSGHEAGTESTNGTITFADVDLSDSHTVSATPQAVGYVGTFTPSIASGSDSTGGVNGTVSWTFSVDDSAIDYLAVGESLVQKYDVKVDDGNGGSIIQTITVTINGTNDAPTISAHTDGAVTEDGGVQGSGHEAGTESTNGTITFADVDLSDSHTVSATPQAVGYVGTFTPSIASGSDLTGGVNGTVSWTFSVDDSAIDYLAVGESLVQKYDVKVDDGNGGSIIQTITVTINGTNDAPTISAHTDGAVTEDGGVQGSGHEAGTESTNGTITFADVDLSDSHTVSATPQAVGYVGTFTPSIASGSDLTGGVNGTVSWTFSVDDSAIDYLAVGESLVQKYDVKVDDGNGGSIIQTITVTINGTNDAPTISAHTDGAVTEDGGVQGSGHEAGTESTNGTITFADVDLSDSHTVSATPQAVGYVGTFTPSIASGSDSTGGVNGTVSWTFSVDDSAIDYLAVGESLVQKYDVKVDDGNGGSIIQTITVTINGTNDAPTISAHTDGAVTEDGGVQGSGHEAGTESTNGTITFADVDLSDSHTVSATPQAVGYVGTFTPSIASGSDFNRWRQRHGELDVLGRRQRDRLSGGGREPGAEVRRQGR